MSDRIWECFPSEWKRFDLATFELKTISSVYVFVANLRMFILFQLKRFESATFAHKRDSAY